MNTKKIISTSSAIILMGTTFAYTASALSMSMESSPDTASMRTEPNMPPMPGPMGKENKDAWTQMNPWIREERKQMNQWIKEERQQMNQGIKDDKMKMMEENKQNRPMMGSGMTRPPMKEGQMMGSGKMIDEGDMNKKPPMDQGGELSMFMKNPLTTEEKTAFKNLMDAHMATKDAIMANTSLTLEQRATKMKDLMTQHFSDLIVYVAVDKEDAFKKATELQLVHMTKKQENRQEFKDSAKEQRQEFNTQAQAKKQALSDKNKIILIKTIDTLSLEKLQSILAKVEKALAVSKKERVLAQLNEIGDMVQNKIDELTGTSSEDSVLSDVLGTNTETSVTP